MHRARRRRLIWVFGSLGLLVAGIVFGLVMENVWLGLLLAVIVSVVWLIGAESRRGQNSGVNDESHGIEL